MNFYRLYLLDRDGHIVDHEEFHAVDDQAAAQVADVVFDSCSGAYNGFEVWNGAQRVVTRAQPDEPKDGIARARAIAARARELGVRAQETISNIDEAIEKIAVTIENALMRSNPKLRENHRLTAKLEEMQKPKD